MTHVYVLTCNTYGDTFNRGVFSSYWLAVEGLRIEREEHPECFYEIEQFILDTPGQVFDGDTAQTV